MKKRLMTALLVTGSALFAETRISVGVHIGTPAYYRPFPAVAAPVVVHAYRPPCPGPGYVWIDGYYNPYRHWMAGYWAMPPFTGAYWVAPRFFDGRYVAGYWAGARGHYRHEKAGHHGNGRWNKFGKGFRR